jgi:hypothetical protein
MSVGAHSVLPKFELMTDGIPDYFTDLTHKETIVVLTALMEQTNRMRLWQTFTLTHHAAFVAILAASFIKA